MYLYLVTSVKLKQKNPMDKAINIDPSISNFFLFTITYLCSHNGKHENIVNNDIMASIKNVY